MIQQANLWRNYTTIVFVLWTLEVISLQHNRETICVRTAVENQ
jgi:hypothetical protein